MVVHRKELRDTLIRVLSLLRNRKPAAQVLPMGDSLSDDSGKLPNIHPPGKDV